MRGRPSLQLVPPTEDEHSFQISCAGMFEIILLPEVAWTAVDHAHSIDRSRVIIRNGREVPVGLIEMKKRQARGIRSGLWDLWFWHRGITHVIELKVGDNDLTPEQEDWGRKLLGAGVHNLKVCWTRDQVFNTVRDWGLTRNAVMS
jgi:hypothetical protein